MFVAALAFAQSMAGFGGTTGSLPVSPSVMATIMSSVDADGNGTLDLLVLWRGNAGWFEAGRRRPAGLADQAGSDRAGGASRPDVRTAWLSQGGVSLSVRFEPSSRKVWIQDQEIDLNESNVVLVDQVDQSGGLLVLKVLRIDPSFRATMQLPPQGAERMGASLEVRDRHRFLRKRSYDAHLSWSSYLRCDVSWPGALPQETQAFQKWCSAVASQ